MDSLNNVSTTSFNAFCIIEISGTGLLKSIRARVDSTPVPNGDRIETQPLDLFIPAPFISLTPFTNTKSALDSAFRYPRPKETKS